MIGVYFEPIVAPEFREGVIRLYILNEARKIATEIKKDFDRTVKTWTGKPPFIKHVGFTTSKLTIEVTTEDENYRRVVEGTSGVPRVARGYEATSQLTSTARGERLIRATSSRGARALTLIPYEAKTTPGKIDASQGGVVEGAPIIFRRYALEAGKIKPRHFDEMIQEVWDDKISERLQQALDAAADKTGFAF